MDVIRVAGRGRDVYGLWAAPGGGRLLALTGFEMGPNRLTTWDLAGNRAVHRERVETDEEHNVCEPAPVFSADFRLMTLGEEVKRVGGRKRVQLDVPGREHHELFALSPGGRTAFGACSRYSMDGPRPVYRWDLRGALRRWPAGAELPANLLWRRSYNGSEYLCVRASPLAHDSPDPIAAGAASPDNSLLAALSAPRSHGTGRYRVLRWRLPGGEPLPPRPLDVPASALVFSPDGTTLAAVGGRVALIDPAAGEARRVVDAGDAIAAAFTPDSARLLTAHPGGAVAVWDVRTGAEVARYEWGGLVGTLAAVAVLPDGLTAVAGGTRGRLVRWDL